MVNAMNDAAGKLRRVDPDALNILKWQRFMPPTSSRSSEEFRNLRDLISNDPAGQKDPVEVYRGGVVDGVQRTLVCKELNRKVLVRFLPRDRFQSDDEVAAYILRTQVGRRNLSTTGWKVSLSRLARFERTQGKTAAQFIREQAKENGVHPKVIQKAVRTGNAIEKLADGVADAVTLLCTKDPDATLNRMAKFSPEIQLAIVRRATSETELQSEIANAFHRQMGRAELASEAGVLNAQSQWEAVAADNLRLAKELADGVELWMRQNTHDHRYLAFRRPLQQFIADLQEDTR